MNQITIKNVKKMMCDEFTFEDIALTLSTASKTFLCVPMYKKLRARFPNNPAIKQLLPIARLHGVKD